MNKLVLNIETGELESVELSPAEIAEIESLALVTWDDIRAQRETLLTEADNLINAAYDDNNTSLLKKLKAYRKSLRDITNQSSPDDVLWPETPNW